MKLNTYACLLTALLAGGGLASLAPAQTPVTPERRFTATWNESGTLSVERLVAGRFSLNRALDAAALRTLNGVTQLVELYDPGRLTHVMSSGQSFDDLALVSAATTDGRDGVAALDADGLSVLTITDDDLGFSVVDALGGAWSDATRLWSVRGASGESLLLGWVPVQSTLLRATWSSATQKLSELEQGLDVSAGLQNVLALEFDGELASRELAIVTDQWLYVLNWDGSPQWGPLYLGPDLTPGGGRREFAVAQRAGQLDLLAYVMWSPALGAQLVSGFNAAEWFWGFEVLDTPCRSLLATDYDGDQRDDLVLIAAGETEARLVRGVSDATRPFAFDAALGGRVVLLDGGCNSNEYLHVVAGDFDDDLDHDLMFAKNDQGATQLYSNGRIAGQRPQVWRVPGSRMIDPVVGGPGYTTSLTLGVQLPSGVIGQPGGPTHLEVLGWFFPQSSGAYEPHAALEHVLALPGNPSAPWQIPVSWTTDTLDPNGSAMLLSTRLVRLNGAQIERQWPADTTYYKYGPVGTLTLVSRVDFQTLANCVSTGGDIGEGTISSGSGSGGNPGPPPTPRR